MSAWLEKAHLQSDQYLFPSRQVDRFESSGETREADSSDRLRSLGTLSPPHQAQPSLTCKIQAKQRLGSDSNVQHASAISSLRDEVKAAPDQSPDHLTRPKPAKAKCLAICSCVMKRNTLRLTSCAPDWDGGACSFWRSTGRAQALICATKPNQITKNPAYIRMAGPYCLLICFERINVIQC